MASRYDIAVLASRFQPVHAQHPCALEQARSLAPRLIVLCLGAGTAASPRTPWSTAQRLDQLAALAPRDAATEVHCLRDVPYDIPRWRAVIAAGVPAAGRVAVLADRCFETLWPADWERIEVEALEQTGAQICASLFWHPGTPDWTALEPLLSVTQLEALRDYAASPACAALRAEAAFIASFRAAWDDAPYPPVFVTVDALVTCGRELLLIERARAPGKGLWALPGGFLDQHETLLEAACREVHEETGLVLDAATCRARAVFDQPERSLRGRTITHAFHFELAAGLALPAVSAGDDAARARWFDRDALASDTLFEDHYAILQQMLGLP